jgi:hypothetical protein
VPDSRKAQALKACFEGQSSPMAPASILRTHPNATVYLDRNSAALLTTALQTCLRSISSRQTPWRGLGGNFLSKARKILSLHWWIGLLLFASTVINYIDRQTLSLSSITGQILTMQASQLPAELYLQAPEVRRRNTRVRFIQPLKERIVREVGYGLSHEGASASDLVKSIQANSEPIAQKGKVA